MAKTSDGWSVEYPSLVEELEKHKDAELLHCTSDRSFTKAATSDPRVPREKAVRVQ
jgi:hypothetical protein